MSKTFAMGMVKPLPKAVTRSVTKTPRDEAVPVGTDATTPPWRARRSVTGETNQTVWDGFALLITRRSQVQILPPLPTRQRYNRRSTARKLSLRAVFVSGGGVRSDQIADRDRLGWPAVSQVGRGVSRRLSIIGMGWVLRDGARRVVFRAVAGPPTGGRRCPRRCVHDYGRVRRLRSDRLIGRCAP